MRIEDERAMRTAYKNEFGIDMTLGMHAHTWKAAWKAALHHVDSNDADNAGTALLHSTAGERVAY